MKLTREQLHDLVWSMPMTEIAGNPAFATNTSPELVTARKYHVHAPATGRRSRTEKA
jgi:hypothetical protein